MVPTAQKKTLHSILASKLNKLTIPSSSSSSSPPTDFDFSDVFGPTTPSLPLQFLKDPEIIHNRSHSFVGPSPRFAASKALPFDAVFPDDDGIESSESDIEEEGEDGGDGSGGEVKEVGENVEDVLGVSKIGPNDFEIMRVVGQGAFGKVFQVISKKGNNSGIAGDGIFAMKVMRKDPIIKKNHVDYMKAERDILTKVVHPFIVQLRYSFQTKSKLYLVMDFINGGHLFFHLYRQGMFSEDQARVYTAEIVSAVSHLHKSGIVHRDLKPENILMDADGHVMLTDFGLAKEIAESSRSNSLCGTTEYMAPEILLSKGHNKDADWWSVGILLYEMLNGQPPFTHKNRQKLQQRIIQEKVKLPPFLSSEAHSLLKGLLQKEPSRRLGSGTSGGDDIKSHKWFRSINWKKLEAKELQPKFKPDVSGKECTANFDRCWTAMPIDDSPAPTPTAGSVFAASQPLLPQFPGSQMSQEPESSSRPLTYLIEPVEGSGTSSYVIREAKGVDGKAAAYIRKVHDRNRSDSYGTSTLSPYSLPPPPPPPPPRIMN